MTVNEIVCSNIVELRKKRGLSQEALAGMLGVTFQAVSKWENQLSCPDIALIPKIAEIFQVSIDFLFGKANGKAVDERLTEWPNDENLYAVIFQGHRMLKEEEITEGLSEIELKYDGDMQGMSIQSCFNITCGDVTGSNIQAGTHITCGDVTGSSVQSEAHITCGDVTGCNIQAGANITAADITGCDNICSGTHISALDIICNKINAGTHINADSIVENEE